MIPRAPLFPHAIDSRACAGEQLGPSVWTCPRCTSQALGDRVHMTRLIGASACHCCKVTPRTRGPIRTIGLHIKETNQISSQPIIFIGSRLMQFVKSNPSERRTLLLSVFLQGGGGKTTTHFLSPSSPQGTPQLWVCMIHLRQMGVK